MFILIDLASQRRLIQHRLNVRLREIAGEVTAKMEEVSLLMLRYLNISAGQNCSDW
jgi:hypothetical protein